MSTLGERIREARQKAGVTKSALAAAADVSPSAVTQWENGDTKTLKSASLLAAARALNVSYEWLATGKGEPVGHRAEQPVATYGLSDAALEIARAWDKLSDVCQDHVRRQIALLQGSLENDSGHRRAVQHDVEITSGLFRDRVGKRKKTVR